MKRATLTRRIATLLVVAATSVFMLTALVVERFLERELAERDGMELVGKVTQIRQLLLKHDLQSPGGPFVQLDDVVVGHNGLGFVLLDASGTVIARAGADPTVVANAASGEAVLSDVEPRLEDVQFIESGDLHWRVLFAEVEGADGRTVKLVIGRDVHATVDLRSTFRATMLVVSLAAAFGTALVAWLIVWRGMRPLATMAAAARRITAHRLTERVTVPESAAAEVLELRDAFNDMIKRLEDAFTRLSRFSGELAHDLRTPITALLLQSQVGLSRERSIEEYQALLAGNIEEFERLQRLVDSMLFLARADNAQIALRWEKVDLHQELSRIADYYQILADERDVKLEVEGRATITADRTLLHRAIGNLVSNAVRHARAGSTVLMTSRLAGEEVSIAIQNEGDAIPMEDLDQVFERFWRGDSARALSEASSGLGLAIVRSIATMHGGDVGVQSLPSGHVVFRMRLPSRTAPSVTPRG